MGVKRWFGLILLGTFCLAVGFAMLALDVYRTAPDTWWLPVLSAISLRFLDRTVRAVIFGGIGLGLVFWGSWGLNRSILRPYMRPGEPVVETVSAYRRRDRGPNIVAIGGGTGLSTLLRGLKQQTTHLTAVVTVADDGGSSGELRQSLGILPPGDIRNCLVALSDDEETLSKLFQYRFGNLSGLNGHSLGNLLISALTDISGSFEQAVAETGKVLAVRGKVLPSTLNDVNLVADVWSPKLGKEVRVCGESHIAEVGGKVKRVWLEPSSPYAFPPAIQAILSADLIVIGPGSLYTSILPNLLVSDLAAALQASKALKFFVCNVATEKGETDGYSSLDHLRAIEQQLGGRPFDVVICNNRFPGEPPAGTQWVRPDEVLEAQYPTYYADLIDEQQSWRHDSHKLAQAIMDLYYEKTMPQPEWVQGEAAVKV
jgi:uncharacterized cofD-like protein